jgi:hypothetical protein
VLSRDSVQFKGWLNKYHQGHKSLFFNLLELIKSGLGSFSVAIQKLGELILTHIEGSHQGYNTGNNLAITVNWANKEWPFTANTFNFLLMTSSIIVSVLGCQLVFLLISVVFKDLQNLSIQISLQLGNENKTKPV